MRREDKIELVILPPKEKKEVTKKEIVDDITQLIFLLYFD